MITGNDPLQNNLPLSQSYVPGFQGQMMGMSGIRGMGMNGMPGTGTNGMTGMGMNGNASNGDEWNRLEWG